MMHGTKKLTEVQKYVLRQMVEFKCEGCKLSEKDVGKLQPHRIIRGNAGGRYIPSNIKMLCEECHKIMHQGERMGRK
jgi:5-methylcytosine-specific restriction endonuclease McrA